jgi:hypothetical protein
MRLHALYLAGALIATAIPLSVGAVPAEADHEAATSARQASPATYACPRGYYWKPARYARHGKFRRAHCTPTGE